MYGKAYSAWMRAGMDAWSLGLEASSVIGLRLAKIARGGQAGADEAMLMVSEKIESGMELQAGLIGTSPLSGTQKTLKHYRRKVAANRRRLSR